MFDFIVRRFLDNFFQPKPPILIAAKRILYFSLLFTGTHFLQIRTQISRLCSAAIPHQNITFIFRFPYSYLYLESLPLEDEVTEYLRFSVVYFYLSMLFRVVCWSTTPHLHTRTSEHLGVSPVTGK